MSNRVFLNTVELEVHRPWFTAIILYSCYVVSSVGDSENCARTMKVALLVLFGVCCASAAIGQSQSRGFDSKL